MTSADARSRAEQLLKQMTIEEKVGQMNQSSGIVMPLLANEKPDNLILQGQVGSILWLIDVKEINRLQHLAAIVSIAPAVMDFRPCPCARARRLRRSAA